MFQFLVLVGVWHCASWGHHEVGRVAIVAYLAIAAVFVMVRAHSSLLLLLPPCHLVPLICLPISTLRMVLISRSAHLCAAWPCLGQSLSLVYSAPLYVASVSPTVMIMGKPACSSMSQWQPPR